MLILLHGLGLSKNIWDKLTPLLTDEVIAKDLPGHGVSRVANYDWNSIWNDTVSGVPQQVMTNASVVLHSFSAAVLPEILRHDVRPKRIIFLEGIVHHLDAIWTKDIANMKTEEYTVWLTRWRKVAYMTLKSQLVRPQPVSDIEKWSSGFRAVRSEALASMARQLQSRVQSDELRVAMSSVKGGVLYLQGSRSKVRSPGIEFVRQCGCTVKELRGTGHFPMLDNPEALACVLND